MLTVNWKLNARIFIFLATIILASCEPGPQRGKDGYYFEQETFVRHQFSVDIVIAKDQEELNELARVHGIKIAEGREAGAFARLEMSRPHCTIYTIDPREIYIPEFLGHELTHCMYGSWHKEPQK